MSRGFIVLAVMSVAACERTGPCAAYDRTAEAMKYGAFVRYCIDRQGRAQGPYTCKLENGLGSVTGEYRDGRRHGVWKFHAEDGVLVRTETWVDDSRRSQTDQAPKLRPLPEDVMRVECDGHVIRRKAAP